MSNTPTIPPGSTPPVPPFWSNECDWIVLIEFLHRDDDEDRARGAESIGYMLGFARMTDTRMLALVGDAEADVYELLFSFCSAENKAEFLRLLHSNDATDCEDNEILVPDPSEIEAARRDFHRVWEGVESRLYGFPCSPYSVISMACF